MTKLKYKDENGFWQELPVGTNVVANPMLTGTEQELTSLQVGNVKYKSGGGGGDVTAAGNNIFTGTNKFQGNTTEFLTASAGLNDPKTSVDANGIYCTTAGRPGTYYKDGKIINETHTLTLPSNKDGTIALTPNTAPTEDSVVITSTDRTTTWKPISEFANMILIDTSLLGG